MSEPAAAYLDKLAAYMRKDTQSVGTNAAPPYGRVSNPPLRASDARNAYGVPVDLPVEARPELERLAERVAYACKGFVYLNMADWQLIVDETTYQAARCLAKDGRVDLPNLGRLEIVYSEHGQQGRLILAPEARP